jgi:hypothetical protein
VGLYNLFFVVKNHYFLAKKFGASKKKKKVVLGLIFGPSPPLLRPQAKGCQALTHMGCETSIDRSYIFFKSMNECVELRAN